jgi:hypothetical protein
MHTVVVLPALDTSPAITRFFRELLGPVHPADPGIHVVDIACANLQNVCNPGTVRRPRPRRFVAVHSVLPLNTDVVCDINKAPACVLHPSGYRKERSVS